MALKQYSATPKAVRKLPQRANSKPNQEDNTESPSKMCCSACCEVQHINELTANNHHTNLTSLSPILPRTAVPDEVICPSPVLGKRISAEKSPVLTHTRGSSPVIGSYSFKKRARQSTPTDGFSLVIEPSSPDVLFTPASTSYNISNDDNSDQSQSPIKISPILTQTVEKYDSIELICSADEVNKSKQIFSVSSSGYNSFSVSTSATTKKKRYKKNGLAKQLQKCISYKNSSIAMWLHEQQFSNHHTSHFVVITLKITEFWEECNNFVMHCSYVSENDSCFAIISINNLNSFVPYKNAKFCLYAPYKTKRIKYNLEEFECFYNISRIKMYVNESSNE